MAKRLIRLFGFATHDAPGEAEAECALLEQQGVVDAVLSEDVDTIMFGCRRTLRNWSAEGTKGSKTPTHVSMYDASAVAAGPSGLDREGMVLVALMSGGDYLPEGVPGCGVKVACEAARAGFGRDLCRIKRADRAGLAAWKERLLHELRTNESGFFRTRHKALEIPESFPNLEVLRYYTHPVVSREATIDRLKKEFPSEGAVDVVGLRDFVRETFDWAFRIGAVKLIRVLAPSLLVQQFLGRYASADGRSDELEVIQREESALVKAISSRRMHFSTDATPELRISFIPAEIVKLDLGAEPEEEVEAFGRTGITLNSDDEFDEEAAEFGNDQSKPENSKKAFDPLQPELVWIPETVAKLGVPLTVEDWEGKQRMKEQRVVEKATRKPRAKKTDMPVGALDKYVKVTKGVSDSMAKDSVGPILGSSPPRISYSSNPPAAKGRSKLSKKTSAASQATQPPTDINPWTLASSQRSSRAAKSSLSSASQTQPQSSSAQEPIIISSSPAAPGSPPAAYAPVTRCELTPTRTKRPQIPPVDDAVSPPPLFSPSPISTKQRLPVSDKLVEGARGSVEVQPARKERPFKRVKSGAEDRVTVSTQKSIRDFGRVLKNGSVPLADSKLTAAEKIQPAEILSDDEDFPVLPLKKPPASSILSRDQKPSAANTSSIIADSDPFASPLPAPLRTQLPRLPDTSKDTPAPARQTTKTGQPDPPAAAEEATGTSAVADGAGAGTDTERSKEADTTSTGTTKLYIPRTSLGGQGYFDEVEVGRDEADALVAAQNNNNDTSGAGLGATDGLTRSRRSRAWRQSDIEVFDLTGDD
ncbi:uncharacterized protein THITE_2082549 [Thermothielavioides terrestris NRRL 8126]|uniref:XPG-I domain-containing protein n=1 Tax=Thermothielavioides terrestris (strain ATCC 38088 / NRRL 8126) TaxID=578455 RepID=G2RGN2_THETT|nr:uncharacterized protein THITE_2082549 [Thermothielavioides terrestris NRRL 8126]AEO71064.1 hypothetical protein THITE_2082549 [Thermothielavioides terrestris NRRL 8126]